MKQSNSKVEGGKEGEGGRRRRKEEERRGTRSARSRGKGIVRLGTRDQGSEVQVAAADGDIADGAAVGCITGKKSRKTYHDKMECGVLMLWLEKRLWSTVKVHGEDKKMAIILDSAVYRHGMEMGWKSPFGMNGRERARPH